MTFDYVLRKLKQQHHKESLLAVQADRFAAGRVIQLSWAIAILQASEAERPVFSKSPNLQPYTLKRKTINHEHSKN